MPADTKASPTAFQSIDLVAGQPGVNVALNATDDGNGTFALPAGNSFTFYGDTYTSLTVCANGSSRWAVWMATTRRPTAISPRARRSRPSLPPGTIGAPTPTAAAPATAPCCGRSTATT
jgi:hypothetical protein